jgi:hypothetical protein
MARNFVIVYSGREGSSAIIKAFADRTDIAIPVIEEFDQYQCAEIADEDVPIILRNMLKTSYFSKSANRRVEQASQGALPDTRAVGFKWRIWGKAERIAEVLRDHDVVVFELLRSDIMNLALSLYLTTYVLPLEQEPRFARILRDPNPQFRIRRLEPHQQEEVISLIRSCKFSVDPARFTAIMQDYLASKRLIRQQYIGWFETCRLNVHTLFYEDFLSDAAGFLSRVATLIGTTIDPGREPFYPKINRDDIRTQITNLTELESNREVQRIKLIYYRELVARPIGRGSR